MRETLKISQETMSLERPIGEEDDAQLGDFIADEEAVEPPEAVGGILQGEESARSWRALSARERQVLELRFGLKDRAPAHLGGDRSRGSASPASASVRSRS